MWHGRTCELDLNEKLAIWQKDLIDMSKRNSLLFYRPDGPRASGLSLQSTDIETLFDLLVVKKGSVTEDILKLPDPEFDPTPFRRLERLRIQARDDAKERGVQSLYIVFGMLDWCEIGHSEERIHSPLLLVPVSISSGGVRSRYSIKLVEDEDIAINPTLYERLRAAFRLSMPTFQDIVTRHDASHDSPLSEDRRRMSAQSHPLVPPLQEILDAVRDGIEDVPERARRDWMIRAEACIGRFSFQKLVMRQDLERNEAQALAHPILRRIAGERDAMHEPSHLVRADELDTLVRPQDTLEILDADSSQQEAIQAAKASKNFVLQGPPGTGKSQTIANIIAECLGQGKKVLFVSEKMAALDVVRKRLQAAGLDEFLLDLHDAKQNRREFVDELNQAVQMARHAPSVSDRALWQQNSERLTEQRNQLNEYVRELHVKRFALDINAYEAYGRLAQLVNAQPSDFGLSDDVKSINSMQLDRMDESLRRLLDYGDVLDSYWSHPWRDALLTTLSSEQSNNIAFHFERLSHELIGADSTLRQLAGALGEPTAAITFGWAKHAIVRAQLALESPLPAEHWFQVAEVERLRSILDYARAAANRYREVHGTLDVNYDEKIYQLDHSSIIDALATASEQEIASIKTAGNVDPHDTVLQKRTDFCSELPSISALLRELTGSAEQMAGMLDLPAPTTLGDIESLLQRATLIAESPIPQVGWLSVDAWAETRIAALDAVDRALWAQASRAELATSYNSAYLESDLAHIDARFRQQYDSVLRYLRPQFYLDVHSLRRYLHPTIRRTTDELQADISTLTKLRVTEQWQTERRADHARIFGRHYKGEQTDWAQARKLISWVDSFHDVFPNGAPEAAVKLATGSTSGRQTFLNAVHALTAQWRMWEPKHAWLDGAVYLEALTARFIGGSPVSANIVAQALDQLHAGLSHYWSAVDQIAPLRTSGAKPTWRMMVSDTISARDAHEFDVWLATNAPQMELDLGASFTGVETDWEHACETLNWVDRFVRLYSNGIPSALVEWVASGPSAQAHRMFVAEWRIRASEQLLHIDEELEFAGTVIERTHLRPKNTVESDTELVAMRGRVDFLLERIPLLDRWVKCGERIMDCRALGLSSLIDSSLTRGNFPRDILETFHRRFYGLWLDAAKAASPALRRFSGETQERIISQFRRLDMAQTQLAHQRLVNMLRMSRFATQKRAADAAMSPDPKAKEFGRIYGQLVREAGKKRSPAIREIVRKVRPALIELKPCWMMSPLTVSQFVETADPIFDLVIFDEASQVLTEDAICSILRGKQLIVVGDEKQLPPTNFFAKSLSDAADDEDDVENSGAEQERTESILKELASADIPSYALKWHYRSQHESLIAFSNSEFYGDQLITFPGPSAEHRDGVRFLYVADGIYDRSGSRTNRREAERVVDLLIELAQRDPNVSIGVVALSGAQQTAIRDALANRFKQHPELAAIRDVLNEDNASQNAFFVKNLESVQGDERDIILLSIGYGKDKQGQMHMQFGPVNRTGGERRLNVAVTRARHRMYVVSSIHGSDINPTQSVGVQTLRKYLNYAEYGPSALKMSPTSSQEGARAPQFDSPFEQAVYEALTARGLQLDTQVGCSGYRIDLAARDPEHPDRYALGIECDGASYHSSKTARDRDRLRQAHLEQLGWTIHRIWSSDWVANPARELNKALAAFAEASHGSPSTQTSEQIS